jgi:hypothetical protein
MIDNRHTIGFRSEVLDIVQDRISSSILDFNELDFDSIFFILARFSLALFNKVLYSGPDRQTRRFEITCVASYQKCGLKAPTDQIRQILFCR